ncbi:MAG: YjbE family putative metal transport protein [Dehalococcoidales bacterium]|nr:YjbE family putative metal transport protein [Dehalococcoidales bacterium]
MEEALAFSWSWDFVIRFLSIALIDLALSGDNAIVIGMAAASVPMRQRKWVIIGGGVLAILLRISLTTIVTFLMLIPLLSAVGGVALFWVAWKLLRLDTGSHEEGKEEKESKQTRNFRQAIMLILVADFMMSLDNVIAIAGTAHGHVFLLIAGLLLSMPLLLISGGVISNLIDKFKWLVFVGAAVIIFTGTRMLFEDKLIEEMFPVPVPIHLTIAALMGIGLSYLFIWMNKRKAKALAASAETDAAKK